MLVLGVLLLPVSGVAGAGKGQITGEVCRESSSGWERKGQLGDALCSVGARQSSELHPLTSPIPIYHRNIPCWMGMLQRGFGCWAVWGIPVTGRNSIPPSLCQALQWDRAGMGEFEAQGTPWHAKH